MTPAYTVEMIRLALKEAFSSRYATDSSLLPHMVGILFAPSGSAITKSEILPRLDDYHHRSGNKIDFFCAGYGAHWPEGWIPDEIVVATTTNSYGQKTEWKYSSKYFNDLLDEVRSAAPRWRYSGDVDLLLLNAIPDQTGEVTLDFSVLVALNVTQLKMDKAIETVPQLFEQIFAYAEKPRVANSVEGFSDAQGITAGQSWLVDVVTTYLPGKVGDLWKKGRHYAVVDATE